MKDTAIVFFGVRGSYPVSDKKVVRYGGNTASVLVKTGNNILVLDAGTGLINIGNYFKNNKNNIKKIDLFLTHLHSDHIQGLPFFEPFFDKEYKINIYCYEYKDISLKHSIFSLFNHPYSPISNKGIKAEINLIELNSRKKRISINEKTDVHFIKENSHPLSGVLMYRLDIEDKRIVYATDIESPNGFGKEYLEFIKGADLLIHDSQYFDNDYYCKENPKKGYGHSTVTMAVNNAVNGQVKKLFLFHYDPGYSDGEIEKMLGEARKKFKNTFLSKEHHQIKLRRE